ncbi:alpha/beta-hydrolase [Lenzites betulinus]|nr:alpha/beta-hydrolase [Lenzites betulinus]
MAKSNILEYQPFKTIYLLYFVLVLLLIKVPIWTLDFLPRSRRARPSWTLKRALIIRTLQELWSLKVDVRGQPAPVVEVADDVLVDAKFTWVKPLPDKLVLGEIRRIAEFTGVRPARIAGYWLLKPGSAWTGPQAKPGEKVVLHMHGGAFRIGTAHPSDVTAHFTRGILKHTHSPLRVFAIDYRLSASAPNPPANPFPAALLDTIAGYRYLVEEAGFAPQDIIVAGDSAGGNLAIGLVRYLLENPIPSLGPPGHILAASPWLDPSMSRHGPGSSALLSARTDIFATKPGELFEEYAVVSLLGPMDFEMVKTNRYMSPVSLHVSSEGGLFKGFPETYVVAGAPERLMDDSTALIEMMRADGVKVITDILPDAVHDFMVFTWHEPERTDALTRIGQWIDRMETSTLKF